MRVYTSYFSVINKIKVKFRGNVRVVSISRITYDSIKVDAVYNKLSPTYGLLAKYKNNEVSWDEYTNIFNKDVLSKLDINTVISELSAIDDNKDNIVLCCYEKPEDNCHRHLVSEWFRSNNIECSEIQL